MNNKTTPFLTGEMVLLGEGPAFQETLSNMLTKAKGFAGFSKDELIILAKKMKAYRVPAGVTIFRERDRNSYLSVLAEGRINVFKEDSNDVEKHLSTIPAGSIFGEISVIDDLPYSASLITETEVTILLMSRESFRQCVAENPAFGVRMLNLIAQMLCARLRSVSGQLVDYYYSGPKQSDK